MNGPNLLSLARMALAIPAAWAIAGDRPVAAFAVMAAALVTDFLDGTLARRSGQCSDLGKVLDPLADKIFVGASLAALVWVGRVPLELVVVVVLRDVVLLSFGWLRMRVDGRVPTAELPGKIAFGVVGGYLAGEVVGIGWPPWAPAFVGIVYVLGAVSYARRFPGLAFGSVAKGER